MILSTVRVFVRDLPQAKQFYAQRLGLPLKVDGTTYGFCVFTAGSVELVVEIVPHGASQEDQALVGRFTGLSFSVPDAHAKHLELSAAGVVFTGAPEKQLWGGVVATFQDPAGNELQIAQYPSA
jgi:predicted enzyme related to lactoylglutathione lyase